MNTAAYTYRFDGARLIRRDQSGGESEVMAWDGDYEAAKDEAYDRLETSGG